MQDVETAEEDLIPMPRMNELRIRIASRVGLVKEHHDGHLTIGNSIHR